MVLLLLVPQIEKLHEGGLVSWACFWKLNDF